MALNCDVQTLVDQAKCLQCIPPGMEMSALIAALCQISSTGGGSGTVTSFSSGGLSPLFTTSVATATSTPALSFALDTQNPNKALWGPTSGADAAPTFRAMVNADLGTGLTPEFARVGLGVAADASLVLYASGPNNGAGVNSFVARIDAPTSNPVLTLGANSGNNGGLISYFKNTNQLFFGVYGAAGMTLDNAGSVGIGGALTVQGSDLVLTTGVYKCQGNSGMTDTFDGSNTVTVVGGLVISKA